MSRRRSGKKKPGAQAADPGGDRSSVRSTVRELTWAEFDALVQKLARSVRSVFQADAVLGVAHGGVFVGGAVARVLGCAFYPVRISPRSRDHGRRAGARRYGELPEELAGKRVLVVDDLASSGDTLELATARLKALKARQVRTATLVRRTGGYAPDHTVLKEDGLIVFPWDYLPVAEDGRFDTRKKR